MSVHSALSSSAFRCYPSSSLQDVSAPSLAGARNERFSFQAWVRNEGSGPVPVQVCAEAPDGWSVRIRRVGYVPVRHRNTGGSGCADDEGSPDVVPGFVPDPLFEQSGWLLPPGETHAAWISVQPPEGAAAGRERLEVAVTAGDQGTQRHTVSILLHDLLPAPRRDFSITHWFYADALSDWYGVRPFSEPFWPLCRAYMDNYAAHGLDMIYVPVFTPPLDGVKKPTQLLRIAVHSGNRYEFDWTDVKRWVDTARAAGIRRFEWAHPFTQWGARHAVRIYRGQGHDERLLWDPETPAVSDTYRTFLSQFLPELHRFLLDEGLPAESVFHVSDEPHTEEDREHYRAARELLRELAPWMTVMDALTDIEYGCRALTDMPVPSIRTAVRFVEENIPCWCYYCCGPRGAYLNRLLDTPLPKIAMHGFLFYRWPFRGFLHWGYNYWYRSQTRELIDPYHVQDGCAWPNWAFGDPFQVYPGPDGPIDSIRWEVFAESLQDYRLLQTLGVARDDPLLGDIRGFDDFPRTASWREQARTRLFARL